MRKLISSILFLLPFSLFAQLTARSLTASDGTFIGFYEYKPADFSTSKAKYPLIVFLHGIGERGNGTNELTRLKSFAIPKYIDKGNKMTFTFNGKTETFVVVAPQLPSSKSSWPHVYTDAMIDYAIRNLHADPNRIILTGLSMGGGGVWSYASASSANASKLAAIVPICGTCNMSNASNIANAGVSVWGFHAQNDNVASVSCTVNAINNINNNNPSTKGQQTIYSSGGHGIWDRAYSTGYTDQNPNVFEWMLQQNKNTSNKLPSANAGSDINTTTNPGSVTLRGSGTDSDGSIVKYAWKKISGPSAGTIANAGSASTTVSGLTATGIYKYELTVVDNKAGWAKDEVQITVTAGSTVTNKLPVARAGSDLTITLPANSVTLNGSSSSDEDGSIKSYSWTKTSGSSATINSASSSSTSITGLIAGTYTFRLTVTDDKGGSHSDEVKVTVNTAPISTTNIPPVANAGADTEIGEPANTVNLSGSLSKDPDGTIKSYKWTLVSGDNSAWFENASDKDTRIRSLKAGTYTVRLTVTDDKNATHSDDKIIKVKSSSGNSSEPTPIPAPVPDPPPSGSKNPVADAGADAVIGAPANTVNLSGEGSKDPDGTINNYKWTLVNGDNSAWFENASAINTRIRNLKPGKYTIRLTVTDNSNLTGTDDKLITVTGSSSSDNSSSPSPTPAPIESQEPIGDGPKANAGADLSIREPANTANLNGDQSTGNIKSYKWSLISGNSTAWFENASAMNTRMRSLTVGTYVVRLTVTDNNNKTSTDDKTIVVTSISTKNENSDNLQDKDAPGTRQAPVANAGSTYEMDAPANSATLSGDKSYDPDGNIVKYEWSLISGNSNAWIENKNAAITRIRSLEPGTYITRLKVTDNDGLTSTIDKKIIVHRKGAISPNKTMIQEEVSLARHTSEKLNVFPNPASGVINLRFSNTSMGKGTINLYDVSGTVVQRISLVKNQQLIQHTIQIGSLKAGIYHVEVVINNNTREVTRFVKH